MVSTADDYLAFVRMLLNMGRYDGGRLLSRPAVELMTIDHLLPPQRVSVAPFLRDNCGWGFGVNVINRRDDLAWVVGTYGWAGGLGTTWCNDPREEMITILLTQAAWTSPEGPQIASDFATLAYQAIDD